MLANKNIAVFIDVDNCGLEYEHYENALNEVSQFGNVVSVKLYGVSDKKHRDILVDANSQGFDVTMPMRVKKRGSKVFDVRIAVDVVETVITSPAVDAVAILAAPTDMVYLYRLLKKYNVSIISLDNADEDSMKLVDETIDVGKVEPIKPPVKRKAPQKPFAPKISPITAEETPLASKPIFQQNIVEELPADNTVSEKVVDEGAYIQSENEPLRADTVLTAADTVESSKQTEQYYMPPEASTLANEAQSLLDQIEKLRNETSEETQFESQSEIQSEENYYEEQPVPSEQPPIEQEQPIVEPIKEVSPDAQAVQEQVERLRAEKAEEQRRAEERKAREQAVAPIETPAAMESDAEAESSERLAFDRNSDSDLIRRIEAMRRTNPDDDDSDLVAQIKSLLEELE
ncbi:MAG: NYN domain-containing protein [Corallococcus sp.]|nr:NYN domain-containing protein [Corallococcus sp.]